MDIHKPKRWHGWPEFVKEIGTIVIGVLIALGGEQVVEAIHRHDQVEQARAALRREVRHDLGGAVLGARNDRCLGQVLVLWEGYATGGPKPALLVGNTGGLSSTTWDIAKAGAVANMPLDERVRFANFYSEVANQMTLVEVQRDFSRRLAGYARLAKLTPQEADDLLRELPGMEGLLRAKERNYANLIEIGRQLAETPEEPNDSFRGMVDKLCTLAATVTIDKPS